MYSCLYCGGINGAHELTCQHYPDNLITSRLKPNQSESQENLWREVTQIVYDNIRKMDGVTVKELSKSFTITRKQVK